MRIFDNLFRRNKTINIDEETLSDLITAFSCKLSLNNSFYWKKKTKKVIEVTMFDLGWFGETVDDLDIETKNEIEEAINASEKKLKTHIIIPSLDIKDRLEIINKFISLQENLEDKKNLESNLESMTNVEESNKILLFKKGFSMCYDFNDLTIDCEHLAKTWEDFYKKEVNMKVQEWLQKINAST